MAQTNKLTNLKLLIIQSLRSNDMQFLTSYVTAKEIEYHVESLSDIDNLFLKRIDKELYDGIILYGNWMDNPVVRSIVYLTPYIGWKVYELYKLEQDEHLFQNYSIREVDTKFTIVKSI